MQDESLRERKMYMAIYQAPSFIYTKKIGKNVIKQLICDHIDIESYYYDGKVLVMVNDQGDLFHFYKRGWAIRPQDERVLVCNNTPSMEKILNNETRLQWVKHPNHGTILTTEVICETWKDSFSYKEEDLGNDIFGLRAPQIGAIHSILAHWKASDEIGTVVMPTGTGKTETMIAVLIANQCERLLVTVPTDSLRTQLSEKFLSLGVLLRFGIISKKIEMPIVGIINEKFDSPEDANAFLSQCNVIVTTMNIVANSRLVIQKEFAQQCSHYFVDEAHHVKAKTWDDFIKLFPSEKIIQFTATPFRNDGQRLNGKIIFNYPMRKAQEEGYFKPINFRPIWEYSPDCVDEKIADEAVKVLKNDIASGYENHIIMARCRDIKRANEVFKHYEKYQEFNPIKIYSGTEISSVERKRIYDTIINRKTKIIVCVDMLGEGFDLPELKIAAFHDIKKSLPVTLQLAGRFTRTKYDDTLGEATFVANLADIDVTQELNELYAQDADWNLILPKLSTSQIEEEIKFDEFIKGFQNFDSFFLPMQNLRPAISTVIYRNGNNSWYPKHYKAGLQLSKEDKVKSILNDRENVLVIIQARKRSVDWGNFKDIQDVEWTLILIFRDIKHKLLFIHSSDNSSLYANLAYSIIGQKTELINRMNVFKAFHNINRVKLQNVGLKEFLGKNIRFRMMFGSDIEEALSLAEKQKAQKAFVFGTGYENGEKVSLGCSYKGRIWTRLQGNIKQLTNWCEHIAEKINDPNIDPNALLKDTLIPKLVTEIPEKRSIWIDWNDQLYFNPENKIKLILDGSTHDYCNVDLQLDLSADMGVIRFSIIAVPDVKIILKLNLSKDAEDNAYSTYTIVNTQYKKIDFVIGQKEYDLIEFFEKYEPMIWFADGSSLCGNEYTELKQNYPLYPREKIEKWDWTGVNISNESQGVYPKVTDSIQYSVIQRLLKENYDIIYDDDNPGEIADVIAIKEGEQSVKIELYHLKFAIGGTVSKRIDNLYEVCGQAQKSVRWKFKDGNELFEHLLRREQKNEGGNSCSRLVSGDIDKLIYFSQITKRKIPVQFEIIIVQPGIHPDRVTNEQLALLSVADNYIKEISDINLRVVGNMSL